MKDLSELAGSDVVLIYLSVARWNSIQMNGKEVVFLRSASWNQQSHHSRELRMVLHLCADFLDEGTCAWNHPAAFIQGVTIS